MPDKKYTSFRDFYPYYLSEHSSSVNRALHVTGTALLMICLLVALMTGTWWMLFLVPVIGYGFAWVGHFFIEKNRPATFTYPLYSLGSDFVMCWHCITGQLPGKLKEAKKIMET